MASNGRSGSTLMYEALREARVQDTWWKKKAGTIFEPRLDQASLSYGTVVKTHDFPDALRGRRDVKVVFCFGPTRDSALSVYSTLERFGADWVEEHLYHMNAKGPFEDLFKYDVLRQAEQVREWATFEEVPVLCVHYDAIWRRQKDISEFIGLEFELPDRVGREPKQVSEEILAAASNVYDPIDAVLSELPEVFLASRKFKPIVDRLPC